LDCLERFRLPSGVTEDRSPLPRGSRRFAPLTTLLKLRERRREVTRRLVYVASSRVCHAECVLPQSDVARVVPEQARRLLRELERVFRLTPVRRQFRLLRAQDADLRLLTRPREQRLGARQVPRRRLGL